MSAAWEKFQHDELPLTTRMRLAADVLDEADKRGSIVHWSSQDLTEFADLWDREDAKTAEKEKVIADLTETIANYHGISMNAEGIARSLVNDGWTQITVTKGE